MTITQQFTERFAQASDKKLIEMFNKEVGISAWGNARAEYLQVMRNEFLRRDFNSSLIISEQSFCLTKKIKVENRKVVLTEMKNQ